MIGAGVDPSFLPTSSLYSNNLLLSDFFNISDGSGDINGNGKPFGFYSHKFEGASQPTFPVVVEMNLPGGRVPFLQTYLRDSAYLQPKLTKQMDLQVITFNLELQIFGRFAISFEWTGSNGIVATYEVAAMTYRPLYQWGRKDLAMISDCLLMVLVGLFALFWFRDMFLWLYDTFSWEFRGYRLRQLVPSSKQQPAESGLKFAERSGLSFVGRRQSVLSKSFAFKSFTLKEPPNLNLRSGSMYAFEKGMESGLTALRSKSQKESEMGPLKSQLRNPSQAWMRMAGPVGEGKTEPLPLFKWQELLHDSSVPPRCPDEPDEPESLTRQSAPSFPQMSHPSFTSRVPFASPRASKPNEPRSRRASMVRNSSGASPDLADIQPRIPSSRFSGMQMAPPHRLPGQVPRSSDCDDEQEWIQEMRAEETDGEVEKSGLNLDLNARALKSFTNRIKDAGASAADLHNFRQVDVAVTRAAAAAAISAALQGKGDYEVEVAAKRAATASAPLFSNDTSIPFEREEGGRAAETASKMNQQRKRSLGELMPLMVDGVILFTMSLAVYYLISYSYQVQAVSDAVVTNNGYRVYDAEGFADAHIFQLQKSSNASVPGDPGRWALPDDPSGLVALNKLHVEVETLQNLQGLYGITLFFSLLILLLRMISHGMIQPRLAIIPVSSSIKPPISRPYHTLLLIAANPG